MPLLLCRTLSATIETASDGVRKSLAYNISFTAVRAPGPRHAPSEGFQLLAVSQFEAEGRLCARDDVRSL